MKAALRWRRRRARVALVGAGEVVASGYMPAVTRLGWSATILDVDAKRAKSVARRYRGASASTRSVAEIEPAGYDAVVVATPLAAHHEVAIAALEAGAHTVVVEKPPFGTSAELESALRAADSVGARLLASFYTRAWASVQRARRLFPHWRERFGSLLRVRAARGQPWSWSSVAARQRGAAGLESLLLEELPHSLDSVFYITGWRDTSVEIGPEAPSQTPWAFSGSAFVASSDDTPVRLDLRGSRTEVLANAVVFEFERAAVIVELSPTGGLIVHRDGGCELELSGIREAPDVRDEFAAVLAGAVEGAAAEALPPVECAEWRGPLAVVEALRGGIADKSHGRSA